MSIPTDEVSSITFKRDTTLQHNAILGWYFAIVTVVLILVVYTVSFAGQLTDPDVDLFTVFTCFPILGGISTTDDYVTGDDYDAIVTAIETDDGESHVFTGRIKNTEFVEACGELIESDLETRNQNTKLKTELGD